MNVVETLPCRLCGRTPYVSKTLRYGRELYEALHRCEIGNVPTSIEVGPCRDEESCARTWNALMGDGNGIDG